MASQGPAPMQMLPPPEDRLYSTFEELHADLKKWTLAQGYALSIDSSSNRDATGIYRRYNLSCIRGGKGYKPSSTGQRNTVSKKTGCLMKIKATKQDGWPWNGRWRITVMCADHNHAPFNPDIPNDVPPAFRHVEGEGLRWLLIMHREAKLNLRQLTIGLRTTFGDKYRFVKKSDVSNTLSKVKREEEKELAKRPPGAPPVPPGAMTAFMAALLNPVPDPYQNGVPYELVPQGWPAGPNYQPNQQQQQQPQQPQQPQNGYMQQQGQPQQPQQSQQPQNGYMQQQGQPQQYVPPQQGHVAPQPYVQPTQQQQFVPQPQVPQQQQQFVPVTQPIQPPQQQAQFVPHQYVPPQQGAQKKAQRNKNQAQPTPQAQSTSQQQPAAVQQTAPVPQNTQAQPPVVPAPVQQQAPPPPMQWKNYTPGPNNAQPQQQPQPQPQQQYNSPYQSPQVPQQPQPQPQQQQQQQQQYQQIPQQQQQPQQTQQPTGARGPDKPGPGDRFQPVAGQPSVYQPTTVQATPVPGVPGAVVMEKAFSDVSDDESEAEQGEEDGEGDSD